MNRRFYLELAACSVRMPIGTDLVLHEETDPEAARHDGLALGRVIERAARRWNTPLAMPLMNLRLEKFALLALAQFLRMRLTHINSPCPSTRMTGLCVAGGARSFCAASDARNQTVAYIASCPDLLPVGMRLVRLGVCLSGRCPPGKPSNSRKGVSFYQTEYQVFPPPGSVGAGRREESDWST